MNYFNENIYELLGKFKSLPFLFIGSGITLRYKKSYNWEGLLQYLSEKANNNSVDAYNMYKDRANRTKEKISLESKIAEYIEEDFNKMWYTNSEYVDERKKNKDLLTNGCSPMKIEIAELFKKISCLDNNQGSEREVELLTQMGKRSIAGVITTNYDTLVEDLFKEFNYKSYVGQEELVFSQIQGSGEIYKIHGCCTKPKSIIINDEDYKEFNKKNAYLAAKLLTIFLEHPIIFLGYKIGDPNVKEILKAIVDCLPQDKLEQLSSRFFFIEWNDTDRENNISDYEFSVESGKSLKMTKIFVKEYDIIYESILRNKSTYNPRVLRKLKEDIYNVALESNPNETLRVLLDIEDDKLNEVEVVVGLGLINKLGYKGYDSITPEDLYEDIIFDNKNYDYKLIVEKSIPCILKYCQSIPIYKYLNKYTEKIPVKIEGYIKKEYKQFLTKKTRDEIRKNGWLERDIKSLVSEYGIEGSLKYICKIKEENIVLSDLKQYIKSLKENNLNILNGENCLEKTEFKRLIKIYDFLNYKK